MGLRRSAIAFVSLIAVLTTLAMLSGTAARKEAKRAGATGKSVTGSYANPVINTTAACLSNAALYNVACSTADPSVIRATNPADGKQYYYAYVTNSRYGLTPELVPVWRSRDMVTWTHVGNVLPNVGSWAYSAKDGFGFTVSDVWAPHVQQIGSRYYLFYSAPIKSSTNTDTGFKGIGYATATSPEGPFTDKGLLVNYAIRNAYAKKKNPGYEIDPYLLVDGTRYYLSWGSGRNWTDFSNEGITMQEVTVNASTGAMSMKSGTTPTDVVLAGRGGLPNFVEGSWIYKQGSYYYLLVSGGAKLFNPWAWDYGGDYAVYAARATSPLGPYTVRAGAILTSPVVGSTACSTTPCFHASGHGSVINDAAGTPWFVYHAWLDGAQSSGRMLMLNQISIATDGYPMIASGSPTATASVKPSPLP